MIEELSEKRRNKHLLYIEDTNNILININNSKDFSH
jgi:hypothetical protein